MLRPIVYDVNEGVSAEINATVKDAKGIAIPGGSLNTFTFTLSLLSTGAIINSRNAVNILNTGGGTIDSSGVFNFVMTPADNVFVTVGQGLKSEIHEALFEWTYNGGLKAGNHRVWINVIDVANVP